MKLNFGKIRHKDHKDKDHKDKEKDNTPANKIEARERSASTSSEDISTLVNHSPTSPKAKDPRHEKNSLFSFGKKGHTSSSNLDASVDEDQKGKASSLINSASSTSANGSTIGSTIVLENQNKNAQKELDILLAELEKKKREVDELKHELHLKSSPTNSTDLVNNSDIQNNTNSTNSHNSGIVKDGKIDNTSNNNAVLKDSKENNNNSSKDSNSNNKDNNNSNNSLSGSDVIKEEQWYWEIDPETDPVETMSELGRGGFAIVYKGKWRGGLVAVKKLFLGKKEVSVRFQREINIMMKMRHPNITLFMGASLKHNNTFLLMEYAGKGNLHDIITGENPDFVQRLNFARDVIAGLNYLHHNKPVPILHRDLKSTNILIFENYTAKLCDFGLATERTGSILAASTVKWMPPEMIIDSVYTKESDVYALGLILWEIVTGEYPFAYTPTPVFIRSLQTLSGEKGNGIRPEWPGKGGKDPIGKSGLKEVDEDYVELTELCWRQKPESRIEVEKALEKLEEIREGYLSKDYKELKELKKLKEKEKEERERQAKEREKQEREKTEREKKEKENKMREKELKELKDKELRDLKQKEKEEEREKLIRERLANIYEKQEEEETNNRSNSSQSSSGTFSSHGSLGINSNSPSNSSFGQLDSDDSEDEDEEHILENLKHEKAINVNSNNGSNVKSVSSPEEKDGRRGIVKGKKEKEGKGSKKKKKEKSSSDIFIRRRGSKGVGAAGGGSELIQESEGKVVVKIGGIGIGGLRTGKNGGAAAGKKGKEEKGRGRKGSDSEDEEEEWEWEVEEEKDSGDD
eukprot:TRINITY_DN1563_c0_g1_i1.p1 TRINITY_DN1563_c0_g1~~TRINITY_DN1563_c0_g1_i1.p1  ORF type:complete len:805 (-),score=318.02 TRINITY_DN1563_c0_g1_i1:111-2525(-)